MRLLTTFAPAVVETDSGGCRGWRCWRRSPGALAENVNIDMREGVPVRELTSVLAAVFKFGGAG